MPRSDRFAVAAQSPSPPPLPDPHYVQLPSSPTMATCSGRVTSSPTIAKPKASAPPVPDDDAGRYWQAYATLDELAVSLADSGIAVADIEQSVGLSLACVAALRLTCGPNRLSPPVRVPDYVLFLRQFTDLFMVLLGVAGLLSLVTFLLDMSVVLNLYLALVLFAIVLLTCTMTFWQQRSTSKVMDSFLHMLPPTCTVVRDGASQVLPAEELVVGDLVWVRNGDKVPADLRVLVSHNLKVENASLTGESELVALTSEPMDAAVAPLECKNVAFNGSLCFDGAALGVVLSVGDRTVIGRIAQLASATSMRETNLQREVRAFVRFISALALAMASTLFAVGVIRKQGRDVLETFINGFLVIIVANVPQGLPATVTSLLTITAQRMAAHNIFVKRLDCVETLGSITLIATDKTGTLTKNVMTVTDTWVGRTFERQAADDCLVLEPREIDYLRGNAPKALLFRGAALCNRAAPEASEVVVEMAPRCRTSSASKCRARRSGVASARTYTGNPSDIALLRFADLEFPIDVARTEYPLVGEIPFSSTTKWQLVAVPAPGERATRSAFDVFMKGAPEVVVTKCSTFLNADGSESAMSESFLADFEHAYDVFGRNGRRVIAVATRRVSARSLAAAADATDSVDRFPQTSLCFVGMVAIMDPPRDDVPDAIAQCKAAGVRVFMVTGDHPLTACAIAHEIGLVDDDADVLELLTPMAAASHELEALVTGVARAGTYDAAVVHGAVLDYLTPAQFAWLLRLPTVVFARTTPQHKLDIVEKSQALGECVCVTGDGVNDAPALKQADVGVAMGRNGSDVAREAADIVLLDDDFSSIVRGIAQGRVIYDNLKKTIAYTLTHLWPEITPVALNLAFGMPAALTSLQILSIDLGTELGPAISLAYEGPEGDIMRRPPRDRRTDRLMSAPLLMYSYLIAGMINVAGCFLAYASTYWRAGFSLSDIYLTADTYWQDGAPVLCTARGTPCLDAAQQVALLQKAAASWYVALIFCQFFHVWVCKTRRTSLFAHGLFNNATMVYGALLELALLVIFVYVPGVQEFMGAAAADYVPWLIAAAAGALTWVYSETMKTAARQHLQLGAAGSDRSVLARFLAW